MRLVIIIEIQKRKWKDLKNVHLINLKMVLLSNHREKENWREMMTATVRHLTVLTMIPMIKKLKPMVEVMTNMITQSLTMMELLQQSKNQKMIPRISTMENQVIIKKLKRSLLITYQVKMNLRKTSMILTTIYPMMGKIRDLRDKTRKMKSFTKRDQILDSLRWDKVEPIVEMEISILLTN